MARNQGSVKNTTGVIFESVMMTSRVSKVIALRLMHVTLICREPMMHYAGQCTDQSPFQRLALVHPCQGPGLDTTTETLT